MPDCASADAASVSAAAEALVTRDRLIELCSAMVDVPSPTGEEAELAALIAAELSKTSLAGQVQRIDETMASAHGRLPGAGDGASLMLYSPIDTVSVGRESADVPWIGPELRPDMRPAADVRGDVVIGLGAQNPKGHAACAMAAAEALSASGARLEGDLLVGFGAGGMPANSRGPGLADGHGVGCARLVELLRPDHGLIAKTGWAVSWEEVGLSWFEVEVRGSHTYVGSRHLLPYRNAIADAGTIVVGLEDWFPQWTERHRDRLIAPQAVVAAIDGGWPHMPAFTPAVCRFWVDLRLNPRTSSEEAAGEFGDELNRLAESIGADVSWRQIVSVPGTSTSPDEEIIQSSIRCWEELTGVDHAPIGGLSGATDANIMRTLGVPTARLGLPKISQERLDSHDEIDFQLGMNAVDAVDMERLTKLLIRIAVDVCGVAS